MFYTTKGLVLRETKYKDNDKILSVLTENLGMLTVKARGVLRKNSKIKSGCQLLCFSEFTLFEKNGYYSINEAEPLQMFLGLRQDIELLSLGAYFAQLLEAVSAEDQPNSALLSLGLNCLYALDKLGKPQNQVKAVFELRLLSLAGYHPEIHGCGVCGTPDAEQFYFQEGCLMCESCRKVSGVGAHTRISDTVRAAMAYILECEQKKMFSFSIPQEAMEELGAVTEQFLLSQLETSFSSLSFYKRLFTTI